MITNRQSELQSRCPVIIKEVVKKREKDCHETLQKYVFCIVTAKLSIISIYRQMDRLTDGTTGISNRESSLQEVCFLTFKIFKKKHFLSIIKDMYTQYHIFNIASVFYTIKFENPWVFYIVDMSFLITQKIMSHEY